MEAPSTSCGATRLELVLEYIMMPCLQVVKSANARSSDSIHALVPLIRYLDHIFESTEKKIVACPLHEHYPNTCPTSDKHISGL